MRYLIESLDNSCTSAGRGERGVRGAGAQSSSSSSSSSPQHPSLIQQMFGGQLRSQVNKLCNCNCNIGFTSVCAWVHVGFAGFWMGEGVHGAKCMRRWSARCVQHAPTHMIRCWTWAWRLWGQTPSPRPWIDSRRWRRWKGTISTTAQLASRKCALSSNSPSTSPPSSSLSSSSASAPLGAAPVGRSIRRSTSGARWPCDHILAILRWVVAHLSLPLPFACISLEWRRRWKEGRCDWSESSESMRFRTPTPITHCMRCSSMRAGPLILATTTVLCGLPEACGTTSMIVGYVPSFLPSFFCFSWDLTVVGRFAWVLMHKEMCQCFILLFLSFILKKCLFIFFFLCVWFSVNALTKFNANVVCLSNFVLSRFNRTCLTDSSHALLCCKRLCLSFNFNWIVCNYCWLSDIYNIYMTKWKVWANCIGIPFFKIYRTNVFFVIATVCEQTSN